MAREIGRLIEAAGAAADNSTDIARAGMLRGLNLAQTVALAGDLSAPVITSGGVGALDLSSEARPALNHASPIVGHMGPLGVAIPQDNDELTRGQGYPCVRRLRPPRKAPLR